MSTYRLYRRNHQIFKNTRFFLVCLFFFVIDAEVKYSATMTIRFMFSDVQKMFVLIKVKRKPDCLTESQRTICLWFQDEVPVDRSIFSPVMYKTLLALWVFLLDTCRKTGLHHCRFHQQECLNQSNASEQHLENLSSPWVQDSDPSVSGGDGQPAAVAIEADGEEQCLGRVAVLDGHQDHSGRTSDH